MFFVLFAAEREFTVTEALYGLMAGTGLENRAGILEELSDNVQGRGVGRNPSDLSGVLVDYGLALFKGFGE
ncbi:hypothetical protein IB265_34835 [Ensifer sp. ENS10]|uniref:hypothetical protein n=1 Tax=Ensifer sp. ENS10 TaxID=2769286 RepID=UPI0017842150|nr:hypothetical protein [Ensifer sp. ENS10]MBD9511928.1 hypothetical protein [Ensifer sp. ENS10]